MPPPAAKPAAPRKRNRKRKRRAASSSSSSSSSSESESDTEVQKKTARPVPPPPVVQSEKSSSESSSDSSSESESELETIAPFAPQVNQVKFLPTKTRTPHRASPSPSPPPSTLSSFINAGQNEDKDAQEIIMKERFRKFWMASVADGFKDDLEQIRKEPSLGTARLSLLIDSLASGADVFTSSRSGGKNSINEVEVILE